MPGFDGTGPLGRGPMTGGGFGYCPPGCRDTGYPGPAYGYVPYNPYDRRSFGFGFRRGWPRGRSRRGYRRWWR